VEMNGGGCGSNHDVLCIKLHFAINDRAKFERNRSNRRFSIIGTQKKSGVSSTSKLARYIKIVPATDRNRTGSFKSQIGKKNESFLHCRPQKVNGQILLFHCSENAETTRENH
jgi:hypothetical protein